MVSALNEGSSSADTLSWVVAALWMSCATAALPAFRWSSRTDASRFLAPPAWRPPRRGAKDRSPDRRDATTPLCVREVCHERPREAADLPNGAGVAA